MRTFLQNDAQLWENLQHTSGGKLEIPKCNFSVFQWEYNKFGRAYLSNDNTRPLSVTRSDNNTITTIPFIPINQSYKYVGIHIALDGNMGQQIKDLQSKCNKMAVLFNQTYFSHKDSEQGFMTIYGPIAKYPLPATSISESQLHKI
jgi:hypothetical protein